MPQNFMQNAWHFVCHTRMSLQIKASATSEENLTQLLCAPLQALQPFAAEHAQAAVAISLHIYFL
jgi:hypothetical protein